LIHNGVIESFFIADSNFVLNGIKVGSPVKTLENKYPKSFHNKVETSKSEFVIKLFIISESTNLNFYPPDFIYVNIKDDIIQSYEVWTAW
jgi:hypothetical protein